MTRFWLADVSKARFTMVRVMLGVTLLLWILGYLPDLIRIFGDDGFTDGVRIGRSQPLVVFRYVRGTGIAVTLAALLIAASLALIAGRFTRVALPVATILFGSFAALGWGFTIGTENVLRAIAATMAVFALLTPSWYLDRASARDPIPGWGVRLVQVQMTILYAATALAKWQGSSWRSGEAIVDALSPVHTLRFQAPAMLSESGVVSAAVTWIVLGLETLLPVLLWHPRTRRIAVVGAILGHAAFGIFIELGLFPLAMTTGLVAFLSDDDAVGVVTWPSRIRASRSGRARPQSRPA